jgi:hypothetical protein
VKLEHLGQGDVERGDVGTEFLPQHPLSSGLVGQALWHPGVT